MAIGDLKRREVIREKIDRKFLIPGSGNLLQNGFGLVTIFDEFDFVGAVVGEIGRNGRKTKSFPIQFDQRPGWICTDREPTTDAT